MKFFKDKNNKVCAFEKDGSQDHLIKEDMVSITQEEAKKITNERVEKRLSSMPFEVKRSMAYPPLAEFADAYVKQMAMEISKGREVVPEMKQYIESCLKVKADIKK